MQKAPAFLVVSGLAMTTTADIVEASQYACIHTLLSSVASAAVSGIDGH